MVLFNSNEYNTFIVREDGTFIDTILLKSLIIKDIEEQYEFKIDIKEYVVLTMLFGNDFLPKLSFLHFNNSIYNILYKAYALTAINT